MLTFVDNVVTGAAANAAREIRTGELTSAADLTTFRTDLCRGALNLLDCNAFRIDVRSFPNWDALNWPAPQYAADGSVTNFGFQPGGASAITTVRILYNYQTLTPGLAMAVDHITRSSTVVMMTEPF